MYPNNLYSGGTVRRESLRTFTAVPIKRESLNGQGPNQRFPLLQGQNATSHDGNEDDGSDKDAEIKI